MIDYLLWLALALGAACAVFYVALRSASDAPDIPHGIRGFVADVRAGLRDRGRAPAETESQVSTLEDFLTAASRPGQAYLGPDEVASLLEKRPERR